MSLTSKTRVLGLSSANSLVNAGATVRAQLDRASASRRNGPPSLARERTKGDGLARSW